MLQAVQLDVVQAMALVCDLLDALKDIRTEAAFSRLFTEATLLADLLGIDHDPSIEQPLVSMEPVARPKNTTASTNILQPSTP